MSGKPRRRLVRRDPDATRLLLQVRGLILLRPTQRRALEQPIQRHLLRLEERLVERSRATRPVVQPLAVLIFGTALGVASMSMLERRRRGGWLTELEEGLADCAQAMAKRTVGSAAD
jgi:hypothetical protein